MLFQQDLTNQRPKKLIHLSLFISKDSCQERSKLAKFCLQVAGFLRLEWNIFDRTFCSLLLPLFEIIFIIVCYYLAPPRFTAVVKVLPIQQLENYFSKTKTIISVLFAWRALRIGVVAGLWLRLTLINKDPAELDDVLIRKWSQISFWF